ncbi:MAG: ATP-binding protein [Chitinispirillaceae bacterium]|nr:ATP-binding protein [Chitinispirillaceae bacterium]
MYIPRYLTEKLKKLVAHFPVVAVTGARQVGKSTLLKHVYGEQYKYFEFDPLVDLENARTDPDLFLDNRAPPLILDEVQYAPEVITAIKRRIDADRSPGQYLLSGSQQWQVMRSLADSLAGRVAFLDLYPFSAVEIASPPAELPWLVKWLDSKGTARFSARLKLRSNLSEQLFRGFMPGIHETPLELAPDYFKMYERTYIERDARSLTNVEDANLFSRFFKLTCAMSAKELNYNQIGREIGLSAMTASRWLAVLRGTFQWHEVPAFSRNPIKRVSRKPKGFCADTGLMAYALAISSPTAILSHPMWGCIFETCVANEINKTLNAMSPSPIVYHWRSHGGAEVDFIIEKDGAFYPVEVKASSHPGRGDTSGISAFRKAHPGLDIAPGAIVAPTAESYPVTEQDWVIPWDAA